MKVTFNWLKQYVDFHGSPEELGERLTMLGLEVENVEQLGGDFAGIVVAQVLTRDKHPNADKLSLCRVNDGQGERQIVCGAQNFKPGDRVPLILPGASLPKKPGDKEPFTIKVGKIRGVESHGMLCSPQELGLPDAVDGLLILREDARVGQPFAEYLGRAGTDVVYDLEITPNRPDLNSVIGIAREIAAITGNVLRLPSVDFDPQPDSKAPKAEQLVEVRVDAPDLCPRYTVRVIQNVKIGPSPDWLRSLIEKAGIRSINNVVDVTNYVMLETGQPLHAFDYHLVAKGGAGRPTIVVRRATGGEKFKTLDNQARALNPEMLLIADEQKAIALAGVMGGQNSEINERTRDVLIESAYFAPAAIRRTSKALGLRTDASYRFERGADIGIADWASARCAQLILQTAGGEPAQGVVDNYPSPLSPKEVTLRPEKTNALLGIDIPAAQQMQFLQSLGLIRVGESLPAVFRIPNWRVDLKREADLIEEIARLYGIEKIPATAPRGAVGSHPFDDEYDVLGEVRRLFIGLGLYECQGQTLISDRSRAVGSEAPLVHLENPLSSDMNVLRPSLLPGLLEAMRHNTSHQTTDLALFETGRVVTRAAAGLQEQRRCAIAITGERFPLFWTGDDRNATRDIYDLKGFVEEFLEQFGLRGSSYIPRNDLSSFFLEAAAIRLGKLELGTLGQLQPGIARHFDLRDAVFLAELNLDLLLVRRNSDKGFKLLPLFPSIRRDIAMLLPEQTTHDAVIAATRKGNTPNLEKVDLFDVFRGSNIPAGQKSVAYAFTYRSPERTLTDAEVNAAHERLVAHLKTTLPATIRE